MRLQTERLLIRDWTIADSEAAHAFYSDSEVMQYLGSGRANHSLEQTRLSLRRAIAKDEKPLGFWAVELVETGEVIGGAILKWLPDRTNIEVGYHFGKAWWGQGFGTELATALVGYGFAQLPVERLVAVTYPENTASQRVLEKVGLFHTGETTYNDIPVELFVIERWAWTG